MSDPYLQVQDSWTPGKVDHLLPSRGDRGQGTGKWEFAPHASSVSVLICHSTTAKKVGILMSGKKWNKWNAKWNLIEVADLQVNVSEAC